MKLKLGRRDVPSTESEKLKTPFYQCIGISIGVRGFCTSYLHSFPLGIKTNGQTDNI
jgi:hypothetical protein